jgi:hypothetical protein
MADESDVEAALVALASAALYPNGTNAASVPGADCRIYRGWPNAAALDSDLRAGLINVTVFAGEGSGRVSTRYVEDWISSPATPSLTGTVAGNSITFAGTANIGQVAGILVDGRSYAYRTQAGDTPASVSANLAALARADTIVQLSGASLTIPSAGDLLARVVADAPAQREVRRQLQNFRVTCWCPTPAGRDSAAVAIDQALATTTFIQLADGTLGRLTYGGTTIFDQSQDALLYRRDLLYAVEYATIVAASLPAMLFGDLQLGPATFIA